MRSARKVKQTPDEYPYSPGDEDAPVLTIGAAHAIAGGLIKAAVGKVRTALTGTSKMPCRSYSLPAAACKVGGRLRGIAGSTCNGCYAYERGHYVRGTVKRAQARKLAAITHPRWREAMIVIIAYEFLRTGVAFWRWHDSGDLQSAEHYADIIAIAEALPEIQFWLPTREAAIVRDGPTPPPNLAVRVSMPMVDARPSAAGLASGRLYSMVSSSHAAADAVAAEGLASVCHAVADRNGCEDCRACWDTSQQVITYPLH